MRVLLVENDEQVSTAIKAALTKQLYTVDIAIDGQAGWELVEAIEYDLILLAVMLPKIDGIQFCKRLRNRGHSTLVMMITSKSAIADRVLGLDSGADDYIVKPIALAELEARIRALFRRKTAAISTILRWGKLQLDCHTREVLYDQTRLDLTSKEFALLERLLEGRVYSQSDLVDHLWSLDEDPRKEEAVRALIKRLRQKLKAIYAEELIETVYGQGYRLNPELREPIRSLSVKSEVSATLKPYRVQQQPQVLVVLSDQHLLDQIIQEADLYSIQVTGAPTSAIAQIRLRHQPFDLIVLDCDLVLPESMIHDMPVLLLKRLKAESEQNLSAQIRGNLYYPITPTQLLEASLGCLEPTRPLTQRVMIIDDDPMMVRLIKGILENNGIQVNAITNPLRLWEELELFAPDLLILDFKLPHMDGLRLCQAVREDMRWSWLPVLFLTGLHHLDIIREIFTVGADDYISKPIIASELIERISKRLTRMQHIRYQADFDPLTNLPTQQRARGMLKQLLHLAHQNQQVLCFAVLRLDDLQHLNQQYGYRYGNQVLQQIATSLRKSFRTEDVIARWSGAEFVIGTYNLTQGEVVDWLAQVLESLHQTELRSPMGSIPSTFRASVAQYPKDGVDLLSLYQAAIATLDQTKAEPIDRILPAGWQPDRTDMDVIVLHRSSPFAEDMMRALLMRGYQSRWFQEGRSGLEELQAEGAKKQVLLLEANLPKLNGITLLQRLKKQKFLQTTPVILLATQPEEAEMARELGCFDYVTVPCAMPMLMQSLRKALESIH
ncbi:MULTISPECIES: response regulator [Leptolyngbya]|uniref:response regulator n=1 Tax=Leptolyngbya TaxID=47251 RepID=UPI00168769E6|nr:response regulator [Leptolyngbya sp. FACHB-1624]MBD1854940.1 response regulator [Leptolyngbya sp. FACHB-1624]